ncbi:hypothetical protein D3C81_755370 [compost metagenome]
MRVAGLPSGVCGTSSRAITGTMGRLEMVMWLSNRIAWIRNQVPVMEMTAMNQIDQTPARRCRSPQKIREPWPVRTGLKKPFQNFLYTTRPVTSEASMGRPSSDTRYQPQLKPLVNGTSHQPCRARVNASKLKSGVLPWIAPVYGLT